MPRQPRMVVVDYPHHVTQRGNNRELVFLDRQDCQKYLELLKFFTAKHPTQILSYCLMPNHVHLLLIPQHRKSLARSVGTTNLTYTQYFNKKYSRTGRIWQSRFFSCVVSKDEYLWNVIHYVEGNPVKAGIAKDSASFEWSSARARRCGEKNPLLTLPAWLPSSLSGKKEVAPNKSVEDEIRKATYSGRFFGSNEERRRLETLLNIKLTSRPRGRPKRK